MDQLQDTVIMYHAMCNMIIAITDYVHVFPSPCPEPDGRSLFEYKIYNISVIMDMYIPADLLRVIIVNSVLC